MKNALQCAEEILNKTITWDEVPPSLYAETKELVERLLSKEKMHKSIPKKVYPFNPSEVPQKDTDAVLEWMVDAKNRHKLPAMGANQKARGIRKIMRVAKYRRNPGSGDIEVQLHRGMSTKEALAHKKGDQFHTSWTPTLQTAVNFASDNDGYVATAWIPIHKIVSIPAMYGHDKAINAMADTESEVVAAPHKINFTDFSHWKKLDSELDDSDKVKYLRKSLKTWLGGAALAGAALTNTPAKAEMRPHRGLSQQYAQQSESSKSAAPIVNEMGGAGLVPIIHLDPKTGQSKMTIHDKDTKKELCSVSDAGDLHCPTQKMKPEHADFLKRNQMNIGDHFRSFLHNAASRQ